MMGCAVMPKLRSLAFALPTFSLLALPFTPACGGQSVASSMRPKPATAADATGQGSCTTVGKEADPLVVDWKPDQRSDLEVLMDEGIAVVHYDCGSFKLLRQCHVKGKYAYKATTMREQTVRMEDGDEIKANLPLGVPRSISRWCSSAARRPHTRSCVANSSKGTAPARRTSCAARTWARS
jgi:hypothetical protein